MGQDGTSGKAKQIKIGSGGSSPRQRRALAKISGKKGGSARAARRKAPASSGGTSRSFTINKAGRESSKRERFFSKRYKLGRALGKGGMGNVYLATDTVLNIEVALKILPGSLLKNKEAADRFKKEALTVMKLNHEHIMGLHTLEVEKNKMFLIMEYVDGCTLGAVLEDSPQLALSAVVDVAACCALALDYAHDRGVLHKDLKPDNIMLTTDSVIKIIDFGTAFHMDDEKEEGIVEGTTPYMSPEQIRGKDLDARTDVYSFAMVLYECLMGVAAYPYDVTPRQVLDHVPAPMSGVDEGVAEVVMRALSSEREDRYPSVGDLSVALSAAASGVEDVEPQASDDADDMDENTDGRDDAE